MSYHDRIKKWRNIRQRTDYECYDRIEYVFIILFVRKACQEYRLTRKRIVTSHTLVSV